MCTVSIIIPVYNSQQTIERCIDSVLRQTFQDYELLLVNDGSKDKSRELCLAYEKSDSRVHLIDQDNKGDSGARNTGLRHAAGKYIQFVDSDDWVNATITERMTDALESNHADWAISGFYKVHKARQQPVRLGYSGLESPRRPLFEFARGVPDALLRFGASWNKLYRKEIIDRAGLVFEETKQANEDAHFNFSYIQHARSLLAIDEPLYYYLLPEGRSTMTTRYRPNAFEMNERIYDALEQHIGNELTQQERKVLNRHYVDKTLIVLRMLGQKNQHYSDMELKEIFRRILAWPKLRAALQDCCETGSQDNRYVEMLARGDPEEVFQYATGSQSLMW